MPFGLLLFNAVIISFTWIYMRPEAHCAETISRLHHALQEQVLSCGVDLWF